MVRRVEQTVEIRAEVGEMAEVSEFGSGQVAFAQVRESLDPEQPRHRGIVPRGDIANIVRLGQERFVKMRIRQRTREMERSNDNQDRKYQRDQIAHRLPTL